MWLAEMFLHNAEERLYIKISLGAYHHPRPFVPASLCDHNRRKYVNKMISLGRCVSLLLCVCVLLVV